MEIEAPYFDKTGKEIKEFAVLKVFHFIGARRKKHYMYKWVRLKERGGKKYWIANHLDSEKEGNYYILRACANEQRILIGTEIVQQYE